MADNEKGKDNSGSDFIGESVSGISALRPDNNQNSNGQNNSATSGNTDKK